MKKDIGEFANSGNIFHRKPDDAQQGATLTITARGTIRASIHKRTRVGIETFWGWSYMDDPVGLRRLIRQIAI